jgi:hypothetical protein
MTSQEFEVELKEIDKDFSVVENPSRPGLSNIFYQGKNYDLPTISTHNIKDEVDLAYRYEFPNGMTARFWSRPEIIGRVKAFVADFKTGKFNKLYE